MARSVLLQLARDSIEEVLEAKRKIDKGSLISEFPLLKETVDASVKIFLENKLRGKAQIEGENISLIESIILNAKKAAFEDTNFSPITTSEYLSCEIEIELNTPDGIINERDPAILETSNYSIQKELKD
ncbi:AMMECR1 domain-containing protein [Sulfurimonas lithotrophica]|uniref:AMMECR1 domain-containing protein n=1 Tax=Sulfurimonas lithotrophica TaxID=2590022 RepID=A0A5P8NY23_9BACT|nr:AMMECR1 domain-containing protein [Sulfurimonas lithotrophica]QFR48332.1 AMMECR1 domain-containing protein [Sulfurimonas lithotrophica]